MHVNFNVLPHTEHTPTHEPFPDANKVGIATATFYPNWHPGSAGDTPSTDKVRGDLALQTIGQAQLNGNQITVVDGGSSPAFIEASRAAGVQVEPEKQRGMSASRRQAFESIASKDGVEVICWTEPEKISIVRDCLPQLVQPVLDGEADIVVPTRDKAAFNTYPHYQAKFETDSNRIWNDILRRHNLLAPGTEDIDAWVGPRIFKNDPAIVQFFEDRYQFKSDIQSGIGKDTPELWPNAIFLPLIAALKKGYRVTGVPVPYVHPAEQTQNELDSEDFRKKRARQQEVILKSTIHFIRLLENEDSSAVRIEKF